LSRRYRAAAYWRGAATVDAPPAALAVETTTLCNLNCPGCLRRWDDLPPQHLDQRVFAAALAWPGVESVLLYGLGEPLLDPDIFARVRAAKAAGRFVQLSTNATLLDEERRRALLAAGPDAVILSLDAPDAETYRVVRGAFDFSRVAENIRAFAESARHSQTRVTIQMVLLPENRSRADAFRRRFGKLPGVTLRFKADETLPRRQATATRRGRRICPVLFAGPLFIRADGSVLPCCHALNEEPLGRLPQDDPAALWNGPRLREMRVLHAAGRSEDLAACRTCALPLPPRAPAALALLLPPTWFRRWLPYAERLLNK